MTVAKVWDGTQWVTIQGAPGPVGPPGPGGLLDFRQSLGVSGSTTGVTAAANLLRDASNALAVTYMPTVNCWWEVRLHVGSLGKSDAAYHQATLGILLSPADADGNSFAGSQTTQHQTVDIWMFHTVTRTFKLTGGVSYSATGRIQSLTGGTWAYARDPTNLWLEAYAWAR